MSGERGRLVLDPGNPFDFDEGSLEGLASELEKELDDVDVDVRRRAEEGYGGPLVEVLAIWQAAGELAVGTVAMARIGTFLQGRWKREREQCGADESPRPRAATEYDSSGKPQWSIRIDLPDGAVIQVTDQEPASRPAPEAKGE